MTPDNAQNRMVYRPNPSSKNPPLPDAKCQRFQVCDSTAGQGSGHRPPSCLGEESS